MALKLIKTEYPKEFFFTHTKKPHTKTQQNTKKKQTKPTNKQTKIKEQNQKNPRTSEQRSDRTLLLILNGVCSDEPIVAQKRSIESDILHLTKSLCLNIQVFCDEMITSSMGTERCLTPVCLINIVIAYLAVK